MSGDVVQSGLTAQQAIYVAVVASTGDEKLAAEQAGYSEVRSAVWRLSRDPRIKDAIRQAIQAKLDTGASALAVRVLVRVLEDDDANPMAHVAAAKAVLDRGGFAAKLGDGAAPDPSAMSSDQLREMAQRLEDELANRARPAVISGDSAPSAPADDGQSLDLLG